jgi:hypothetical protein
VGIQGAFLAGVYGLAFLYLPPGRMEPIDSLAPPESKARLAVRLTREQPFTPARGVEGVELLLRPTGIGGPPGGKDAAEAGALSAVTSSEGIATFEIETPGGLRSSSFLAHVKGAEALRSGPKDCEVVLGVVPLDAPLLLVSVPDAVSADLDENGGLQGPRGPAVKVLADEQARGKGLVYLAPTRTKGVLYLRSHLKARGFPEAPILESGSASLRQQLSGLDLARWKGERWAVTASREEAVDFAFHGFRAILLGTQGGSVVDGRSILSAADWAAVKDILAGPGK